MSKMGVDTWDREADVVVIGCGAAGLPAAAVAREAGVSVIVVEAQPHIGGHAITSGGNLPLGGGTSYQKKYGIADSPDLFFRDLTDWSVVETNGFPPYRYNDREIMRAFADNSVLAFEFLLAHGVKVIDRPPNSIGHEIGVSVPRTMQIDVADWPMVHTGKPADPTDPEIRAGAGLIRPLEAAARNAGADILVEHR
jgi:succinate dehydrogenase/fumarate reductase flavoprotein subunit